MTQVCWYVSQSRTRLLYFPASFLSGTIVVKTSIYYYIHKSTF